MIVQLQVKKLTFCVATLSERLNLIGSKNLVRIIIVSNEQKQNKNLRNYNFFTVEHKVSNLYSWTSFSGR